MKSSQWYLIGIFLILMSFWFMKMDMDWEIRCNFLGDSSLSDKIYKADMIACMNAEILDPFIWLLFPLGWIFIICGRIEKRQEDNQK